MTTFEKLKKFIIGGVATAVTATVLAACNGDENINTSSQADNSKAESSITESSNSFENSFNSDSSFVSSDESSNGTSSDISSDESYWNDESSNTSSESSDTSNESSDTSSENSDTSDTSSDISDDPNYIVNDATLNYSEEVAKKALAQSYFTDRAGADVMLEGYELSKVELDRLIPDPDLGVSVYPITNELGEVYNCYAWNFTWTKDGSPDIGVMLPFKTTNKNLVNLCNEMNIPTDQLYLLSFEPRDFEKFSDDEQQYFRSLIKSAELVLRLDRTPLDDFLP